MANNAKELYFTWLVNKAGNREITLLHYLFSIEYYSIFPNDDNRAGDGRYLREIFENETNLDTSDFYDEECTMLEMLLGVASRMDEVLFEPGCESQTSRWFWELIGNLKLEVGNNSKNDAIINKFLERLYDENGRGGIFPLNKTRKNQTQVEIWYQMMDYVDERYP